MESTCVESGSSPGMSDPIDTYKFKNIQKQ